jgi:hypothetical protein
MEDNMKKNSLVILLWFLTLFCYAQSRMLTSSENKGVKRSFTINKKEIKLENEKVFLINRNQQINMMFPLTSEKITIKISPTNNWEDNRALDYTSFQKSDTSDSTIIIFQGRTIPDNYYLLIIFGNVDTAPLYILKMKTATDFSNIKSNLLSPLSLGGAFSVSLDGEYTKDLSPMFYYHFDYTKMGDSFFSYLLTGSIGIICNPSLATIDTENGWANLLTAGIGIGFFENVIVTGVSCSFQTDTFNWFVGLNIK